MTDPRRARRAALESVEFSTDTHARLWLDRYLTLQTRDDASKPDKDEAKRAATDLIQTLDQHALVPAGYERALRRRIEHLRDDPTRVTAFVLYRCVGRLAAGLGEAGVLENGLAIQHAWGLPYLPGPSLKGVAAAAAHKLVEEPTWHKTGGEDGAKGEAATLLFGDVDWRGSVEFLDGWFVPDKSNKAPYHLDIMTPHNSSYYQGKSAHATPTGQDSPVPVSFLSASGYYAVALSASHEAAEAGWLDAAMQLLELGLQRLGIGAKTNAGYGRMEKVDQDHDYCEILNPKPPPTIAQIAESRFALQTQREHQQWVAGHVKDATPHDSFDEVDLEYLALMRRRYFNDWSRGKGGVDIGGKKLKTYAAWLGAAPEPEPDRPDELAKSASSTDDAPAELSALLETDSHADQAPLWLDLDVSQVATWSDVHKARTRQLFNEFFKAKGRKTKGLAGKRFKALRKELDKL